MQQKRWWKPWQERDVARDYNIFESKVVNLWEALGWG